MLFYVDLSDCVGVRWIDGWMDGYTDGTIPGKRTNERDCWPSPSMMGFLSIYLSFLSFFLSFKLKEPAG